MREDDALYCARNLRHAALGALLGGPVMAALAWLAVTSSRSPLPPPGGPRSLATLIIVAAVLIGVWLGATLSCLRIRTESVEERCYGGTMGCVVYLVGGVVGAYLGKVFLGGRISPVACYLAGGTFAALLALVVAYAAPGCRRLGCDLSQTPQEPAADETPPEPEEGKAD